MITVNLKGGLGNQFFQYATGRYLSLKNNRKLSLNIEFYENTPSNNTLRNYQLSLFNIDKKVDIRRISSIIFKIIQKLKSRLISEGLQFSIADIQSKMFLPVYLNGYFQKEKYFKDIRELLLNEFVLTKELGDEAKKIKEVIEKNEAVCIGIRRGDYLLPNNLKIYGVCSLDYYQEAIKYIRTRVVKPLIFVFSDDTEWGKKEFISKDIIFIDNTTIKDYEQMYLMSLCKHNVIANSTFYWWGAWLNKNPNKIVIAPKQWLVNKTSDELEILPKDWIQI